MPRSRPGAGFVRRLAVAALGLAAAVVSTTMAVASEKPRAAAKPASASLPPSPTEIYRSACLQCHDRDGQGKAVRDALPTIPDFTNPSWHASRTDETLSRAILRGKGRAMRPMKKKLGSLDVTQMVSFVRAFRGGGLVVLDEDEPPPPAQGEEAVESKPAPAPPQVDHPRHSPASTEGRPASAIFAAKCQECHDTDGRGRPGRRAMPKIPDFTNPEWQASRTDADLRHSVSAGKGEFMPPMKDELAASRTDVSELVAFVRGFAGKKNGAVAGTRSEPPPTTPRRAAVAPVPSIPTDARRTIANSPPMTSLAEATALYRNLCLACHGPDGRGSLVRAVMPAVPDFTSREWQSGHDSAQLSVSILEGKGALMPPWRGKLSNGQARDLVAYVRAFGPADLVAAKASRSAFGERFRRLLKQWDELDRKADSLVNP